ncbi:MAG: hypothetical protein OQK76_12725 [Gammaproteobacteria bacterium]|nr:hypothetical protein [Gammaproteobacteria bacterium]MCW8911471.1 hypothetical protein [Gammaproteobacteria bacterium]MCW9005279.1 hypothetical protein [Gammaproteobacteria bacterium]MCW9055572.1 hypothetical protein [Gammaproteobacteria bacterium]
MQIDAPFSVSVVDNSESQTRELHLSFTDSFQNESLENRIKLFNDHIESLSININTQTNEQTLQGMNTILQISEQLQPHIINNEIPLDEKIIIEIGPSSPFDQLLSGATLK